jgi:hypothetical protein
MYDCATKLSDTVLPILHYFFDLRLPRRHQHTRGATLVTTQGGEWKLTCKEHNKA